jgi:hypothetical protein
MKTPAFLLGFRPPYCESSKLLSGPPWSDWAKRKAAPGIGATSMGVTFRRESSPALGGGDAMLKPCFADYVRLIYALFDRLVVPPLSVVGWKTFPKASKRDEIG